MIKEKIKMWTENEYFDPQTRQEVLAITDPKELEERFCCDLEFGTAGMRGILGAGTNRLNIYWIRRLAQGLADTILATGKEARERGVVIAYDSRRYSPEFALESALVLAANGIKAYLFDELRPTPQLSFAVRYLKAIAGIMITASHNPKEYNGCKVYWEDGGQIPPDKADEIAGKIQERNSWEIPVLSEDEGREKGLVITVGRELDRAYLTEVKGQLLNRDLIEQKGSKLNLLFTPLHGTGKEPVQELLSDLGFSSLFLVPEQAEPDTEFSTVPVPNPEDGAAYELALHHARERKADLILATDPDADRLGVMVKSGAEDYQLLTGNQIGVILQYYLLSQRQRLGILPKDGVVMKSIASTDLADEIARGFGVRLINVLVGFKYIGEQIKDMEKTGQGTYLFGFEESHGYLAGTYARDKDAVQAAALMAEAALYYQEEENKTIGQVLEEIYQSYGYYLDEQVALSFSGLAGKRQINELMEKLRQMKARAFGGLPLAKVEDYFFGQGISLANGEEYSLGLPQANVLRFAFQGGGYVMARPSGTEPKIRFYFCVRGDSAEEMENSLLRVKEDFFHLLNIEG